MKCIVPVLALVFGCGKGAAPEPTPSDSGTAAGSTTTVPMGPPNVLIVVADDLGVDHVNSWGIADQTPPQPTIDALATNGVRFENAWAYSKCSPTRGALLTGRYGRRNGAIDLIGFANSWYELPLDEVTIAEALPEGWASSAVGKWHLGAVDAPSGAMHPLEQGFDWHAGSPGNLDVNTIGDETDYFRWEKWVNGQTTESTTYATTDTVDDALSRAAEMPEPWLLYVAFNAPHYPMHVPPAHLHSDTGLSDTDGDARKFDALVEAFDTELGRLLGGIDPEVMQRTTVIFVGDNGTPRSVVTPPFDFSQGKQTPYELGIRVPLIVSGAGVANPGRSVSALVHVVDVFPTVADLTQSQVDHAIDGFSLMPWMREETGFERPVLYGEQASPLGGPDYPDEDIAIGRTDRFKLIRFPDHDELYDLDEGTFGEQTEILSAGVAGTAATDAYEQIDSWLTTMRADLVYEGPPRPIP